MKTKLLSKIAIFSLSLAVAAGSVGCEREAVADMAASAPAEAVFKKTLTVSAEKDVEVALEVGATDADLLDRLQASDFVVNLDPQEAAVAEEVHDDARADAPRPVMPARYISVKVLATSAEVPGLELRLSEALQARLRDHKIGMRIDLSPADAAYTQRAAGWWYRTPYCKKVTCYGDGGQIPTGVTTYRPTSTGQLPVHSFTFFNSASCTACSHGVTYLDDIWVWQDVLRSVSVYYSC